MIQRSVVLPVARVLLFRACAFHKQQGIFPLYIEVTEMWVACTVKAMLHLLKHTADFVRSTRSTSVGMGVMMMSL